jgi:hypothetical protein
MLTGKAERGAERAADVLDDEIRADHTRHVLNLIDRFGSSAGRPIQAVGALASRPEHVPDEVELRFDRSDRATLAGVWDRGIRKRQRVP